MIYNRYQEIQIFVHKNKEDMENLVKPMLNDLHPQVVEKAESFLKTISSTPPEMPITSSSTPPKPESPLQKEGKVHNTNTFTN